MRSIWTNFGLFIVLGLIAVAIYFEGPRFLNERCKDRWPPFETDWHFKTGCLLKIQGVWYREDHVYGGSPR
jgi:hypothetical protein